MKDSHKDALRPATAAALNRINGSGGHSPARRSSPARSPARSSPARSPARHNSHSSDSRGSPTRRGSHGSHGHHMTHDDEHKHVDDPALVEEEEMDGKRQNNYNHKENESNISELKSILALAKENRRKVKGKKKDEAYQLAKKKMQQILKDSSSALFGAQETHDGKATCDGRCNTPECHVSPVVVHQPRVETAWIER